MSSCLEACNRRFQGAAADGVSWADLNTFYSMPDTLRGGVLKQAGEVFAAKLRAAYLHLEEAWRDDALRLQFCELPLGTVCTESKRPGSLATAPRRRSQPK